MSEPSWSEIAGWYDDLILRGSGPHETALMSLLSLVPPLAGQSVLDLACGQGLATRALAEAGAQDVLGVDSSRSMLELAEGHGQSDGGRVSYRLDDAQRLESVSDGSVDGVTCQLGLMDIPDLDATLGAIARILRPRGWLGFVIGHPCFLVPDAEPTTSAGGTPAVTVTDYFDERFWRSTNPCGVRRAGNHHRTLTTYLNAMLTTGFVLEAVDEPVAGSLLAEQQPLYSHVPIFFAARARLI